MEKIRKILLSIPKKFSIPEVKAFVHSRKIVLHWESVGVVKSESEVDLMNVEHFHFSNGKFKKVEEGKAKDYFGFSYRIVYMEMER